MPLVSVVTTTYNRAHILPRAIRSVLLQNFSDFEYIVVNDKSEDNTMDVLKEFHAKDSRIKIIDRRESSLEEQLRTGSFIEPLNDAFRMAKGKYIAPINDDDLFCQDRLRLSRGDNGKR